MRPVVWPLVGGVPSAVSGIDSVLVSLKKPRPRSTQNPHKHPHTLSPPLNNKPPNPSLDSPLRSSHTHPPLQKAMSAASTIQKVLEEHPYAWLGLYFMNGLTLTLYNKAVMQFTQFKYPWTLTGIHNLCAFLGCLYLQRTGVFSPKRLSRHGELIMLAFSVLYTVNIAMSNLSLNLVTVPFHQIIRATTPMWVMLINFVWLKKQPQRIVAISLLPTILGVAIATYGDYYFTRLGFIMTVLGTVLSALKGVVTNVVQVGELKMHPLDLLFRMAPLAVLQTAFISVFSGELGRLRSEFEWTGSKMLVLLGNGLLAGMMNFVSFTANKKTSALTMGVAGTLESGVANWLGNIKQVLSILLAVFIFSLHITASNGLGIVITLCGGAFYTYIDHKLKTLAAAGLPVSAPVNGNARELSTLVEVSKDALEALEDSAGRSSSPSGRVSPRLPA